MCSVYDRKLTILALQPVDAVKTLCEKNYGLHMMLIYPNMDILRQFYCTYIKKEIVEYNGIVIIAPYYETIESVRSNLSQPPYLVDVAKYEGDGSLIIVDATKLYSTNNAAVEYITNIAKDARSLGKSGVTVMGDMGIFHTREHPNAITDYEISFLPKRFSVDRKGFCLYDEKDIGKLSVDQTLLLFEQHGIIIELKIDLNFLYRSLITPRNI